MNRFLLFLLVLSFPFLSQSQSSRLKGSVADNGSDERLPGAAVYDLADKSIAVITDGDGNYDVALPAGIHTIICSLIGMKSDTSIIDIQEGAVVEKHFRLSRMSKMLNLVVVSAGKYEQKIEDITVSMEVLSASMIENRDSRNITDAL